MKTCIVTSGPYDTQRARTVPRGQETRAVRLGILTDSGNKASASVAPKESGSTTTQS